MKRRTSKAKAKSGKRLSRPLLDKMIHDLVGRLGELKSEAGAFATLIEPNVEHILIEHQTRTACGVLLHSLQCRIRDVEGFAGLMAREEVSG